MFLCVKNQQKIVLKFNSVNFQFYYFKSQFSNFLQFCLYLWKCICSTKQKNKHYDGTLKSISAFKSVLFQSYCSQILHFHFSQIIVTIFDEVALIVYRKNSRIFFSIQNKVSKIMRKLRVPKYLSTNRLGSLLNSHK